MPYFLRQMYRLFIVISFLFASAGLKAQSAQSELYDEPTIIYRYQMHGGGILHSNGLGVFFNHGWYRGVKKVWLLGVDALYMKHDKEVRSFNPVYEDSRSYIYGKVNNFYILRPGVGVRKVISEKVRKSGVQVAYQWMVGPSIGITKPIYLEIGYGNIGRYDYVAVERYNPDEHFFDSIYGRASGLNGIDDMRLRPGAFFKFALNFEYASEKDRIKALDAGITVDAFPSQIPIMAESLVDRNKQVFLTFFLNFSFGTKYNAQ